MRHCGVPGGGLTNRLCACGRNLDNEQKENQPPFWNQGLGRDLGLSVQCEGDEYKASSLLNIEPSVITLADLSNLPPQRFLDSVPGLASTD